MHEETRRAALHQKLKTALDETRLLILGAQVLMGFQLHGMFQDNFEQLAPAARALDALALLLVLLTIALLITPSMQHRLVERGQATVRIHRVTTAFAGAALFPFAISLGLDLFLLFIDFFGVTFALAAGAAVWILALGVWYALPWLWRRNNLREEKPMPKEEKTPLHAKVEQMLTEARVLIPGAQALLGFQMTVLLTTAFDKLPHTSKLIHLAALCCMALAVILLMAPAAIHRIAFGGEDSEEFHGLGTKFIVMAAVPLAAGLTGDLYVAVTKATNSSAFGATAACLAAVILTALWFIQPLILRKKYCR